MKSMTLGIKELIEQIGPAYTERFLLQCKPNESDYSVERHKLLADQPDIDTIVKRIEKREADRKEEERIKTERVAAWRKGVLELTDIEIYELAVKILVDNCICTDILGSSSSISNISMATSRSSLYRIVVSA